MLKGIYFIRDQQHIHFLSMPPGLRFDTRAGGKRIFYYIAIYALY